jgi:hypothetical protein
MVPFPGKVASHGLGIPNQIYALFTYTIHHSSFIIHHSSLIIHHSSFIPTSFCLMRYFEIVRVKGILLHVAKAAIAAPLPLPFTPPF